MHTFAQVLDAFLARCEVKGLEPATRLCYRYFTRKFLVPALGNRSVAELAPHDFDGLYQSMLERGYVPSTIRKCHATAGCALKLAQRNGWVTQNVARLAELPKNREPKRNIPDPDALLRFLDAAAELDRDVYDLAIVGAATGMRPGEVCGIRQDDIDEYGVLTVSRSIDVCEGGARIKGTKTGKTRRVTLDPDTLAIVRARGGPYVFGGENPARTDLMSKRFKRVARHAGVKFTPRSLRHFHATQLLASGKLSVRQVAERLGHANPAMTLNVYSQAIPAHDAVAADVISSVLRPSDSPSRDAG